MQYRNEQPDTSSLGKAKILFRKMVGKSPPPPNYAFDDATKGDGADFSRHMDFLIRQGDIRQGDIEGQASLISKWPQPSEALRDVLDVHGPGEGKEEFRARALADLSGHLPAERMGDVLGAAKEFKNEYAQGRALTGIAPHLSSDELQRGALDVALSMRQDLARVKALVGIMPHLSDGLKQEAVQAGSRVVQSVKDEWPMERDVVTAFDSLASKHSLKSTVEIKGSANGEVKRDVDNDLKRRLPASRTIHSGHRVADKQVHSPKELLDETLQNENNHPAREGNERSKETAAQTKGGFASVKDEVSAAFAKTKRPQRSL